MPKILDQMRDKILECAKNRLFEEGVNNFSLRDIAKDCDIAVGTIYNYFKSKELLIATIMLEDWKNILNKMDEGFINVCSIEEGFLLMYHSMQEFIQIYENIWSQSNASKNTSYSRHDLLQEQIKTRVDNLLSKFSYEDEKCMNIVLSECVLSCALHKEIDEKDYMFFIHRIFRK